MNISFPDQPNARNAIGEPVTISQCGHFRLLELAGEGFYAHVKYSKGKEALWHGIPGQPFGCRADAIRACGQVSLKRTKFGHTDVRA